MNKRYIIWFVAVFAVFALILTAVELSSEHHYKKAILSARLESYSDIIARTDDYASTVALFPEKIRVSVVRTDGSVIFDSHEAAELMDNHLSRPEIAGCLSGVDGCSIRKSETAGIDYIYYARRYGDTVVRTALPFELKEQRFMHPDWMLLMTIAFMFIAGVLIIFVLSRRFGAEARKETDAKLQSQKRRMTGNIAHELRTPVTSIRGYLETLVDNPGMDTDRRNLFTERAYLQTLRLSDLIRDISLITKMEEAPELLTREHLGIRKLTEEVFDEFAGDIESNGIRVENHIPEDLCVKGNHSLLYALFRNLVENSIRYAGNGTTITLACTLADDRIEFRYMDNGKGVSNEHLEHIFERFYRVPEENAHRAEGSGLGLSIVRNAVTFHGGTITASPVTPHGLCFRFSLPA
ncbi:MAG: ATP-binding protein [Bacteroidales bacterium]|nr:ATP-binding protein [Bacteroidales bacterium]